MPGTARWRRQRIGYPADIASLAASVLAQGAVLTCLYDRRVGQGIRTAGFLDSWSPAIGGAPLLCAADALRPSVDGTGLVTFDGVDDYLRAASAFGIVGSGGISLIAKGQTAIAGRAWELSIGAGTSILAGQQAAGPTWTTKAVAGVVMVQNAAAPQMLHSRKTSTVDVGSQVAAAAEVTAVDATGNQTPDRFTLGNNRVDAPSAPAPLVGVAAIVFIAGVVNAAIRTAINAWATANHGAA